MRKILLCLLAVMIMPAALNARIGAYYNIGIGPASSVFGMNLELQAYNAAINIGYGTPDFSRLAYDYGIYSFGIRGYTHDRESSPYLALMYTSGMLTVSPGEKDEPVYSVIVGFRWLLNNILFGDIGAKFCISLGLGISLVQRNDIYMEIVRPPALFNREIWPMLELSIGSGWLFLPWN